MIRRARMLALPAMVFATATATAAGTALARSDAPGVGDQQFAALSSHQIDTTALATVAAVPSDRLAAPVAVVVKAHAETLRPAPLPNPDVDAPGPDAQQLAAEDQASLHPSFYANTKHFAGDGYAPGSTLENDQNNRRKPGGGMSLSIPMQ